MIDKYGEVSNAYKGNSGAAVNAEIDFNRIVKTRSKWLKDYFNLNTYVFGDAGTIAYTNSESGQQLSPIKLDAGAGVAFTIKKWGVLQNVKPLTIRFDVPFYDSNAPAVSPQNVKFRWVMAIGRTF